MARGVCRRCSPEVLDGFEPAAFASASGALAGHPPRPRHGLLVACAGDQVVGFAAVGPSQDPDAGPEPASCSASACTRRPAAPGTAHACSTPPSTRLRGRGGSTRLTAGSWPTTSARGPSSPASGLSPTAPTATGSSRPTATTAREVRLVADLVDGADRGRLTEHGRDLGAPTPAGSTRGPPRAQVAAPGAVASAWPPAPTASASAPSSVAAGLDLWQTHGPVAAAVLRRLAVRLRRRSSPAGLPAAPAAIATSSLLGIRNGLYGLQVARLLDVRGPAPGRGRPADHRRVDGGRRRPARARGRAGSASGPPAWRSSCCGTP